MTKRTFNYIFASIFCLVGISAFSQNNEDIITLKMPNQNTETITLSAPQAAPSATIQKATSTNEPIFIADGVVIKNLNVLDPTTIVSVDVIVNKVIITTNKSKTITEQPSIAANF